MNAGILWAQKQIIEHFNRKIEEAKPKRDPILGKIVKLPDKWYEKHNYGDWAREITHGKVNARVVDNNFYETGRISVTLLKPDGTKTGQSCSFDQWELSLSQEGDSYE